MELEFVGAARTVTGSMHLLRSKHATVLLDCGLYQGRRKESRARNEQLPLPVREIDAVILSHAHIDHSGALPLLVKRGFSGTIFCTPATRDLAAAMLEDAAMIQAADAKFINKQIDREGSDMDPVEPLYDRADVVRTLSQMVSLPYGRRFPVAPGMHVTFLDAGHVLGSAITVLDLEENKKRLVFTGDLGRAGMPILRDPDTPDGADVLITESTYGDRLHAPYEQMDGQLAGIIKRVTERGGKVIIPTFALERAQELIYSISRLRRAGEIPAVGVYVDSPLTVKITEIFKLHPECYDDETRDRLFSRDSPFEFAELAYVGDKEESKQLDLSSKPSVILSASGMCEAGRVLHHLKATVEDPKNAVVIVGYQAEHTLGRRIVERRPRVKIFGVERELRAEVQVLNGFSAHADQADLLAYADGLRERGGKLEKILLVHGEPGPQRVLADKLARRGHREVLAPAEGDRVSF
ncbi:MAG: MBL fold metallo-hydrolase [Polyangiaceae bacterium]|nr:MBL fold metallo-hydrolase [Polyangiaceae bacterium]